MDFHSPVEPKGTAAFILCGGLGTRLRPVLVDRPKSMALVAGAPFLQILIARLRSQQVKDITLGTGYMAESIASHFANGDEFGVRITYSQEDAPLGTAGAVKHAESYLSDPALILNGDSYAEWNLGAMRTLMASREADVIMVLQSVEEVSRYGTVSVGSDNRIIEFLEKGNKKGPGLINSGVYLLRQEIIRTLPTGTALSLERDVFPRLLDRQVYGCIAGGTFIDIGLPEDLRRAQILLAPEAALSTGPPPESTEAP